MQKLQQILNEGVEKHAWPGAALALLKLGTPPQIAVAGTHTYQSQRLLKETDLFDLASLSKVLVTTTLAAELIIEGSLDLETKIVQILPEFCLPEAPDAVWRRQVSIRHLLAHCSGLPAGFPFYRLPRTRNRDFRQLLCKIALLYSPGSKSIYSDLGIMLLGEIIQVCRQQSLEALAQQRIFQRYGLSQACYNPPLRLRCDCVPTEIRSDLGIPWQGVVHDENARWLGGVAAHAGVFANILDLCCFAESLLAGKGIFGKPGFSEFIRPAGLIPGSSRCLGWDGMGPNSSGGRLLSPTSFGHTGFTGTSLWIDPQRQLAIILLSNAVYPQRKCKEQTFLEFRRSLHERITSEQLYNK